MNKEVYDLLDLFYRTLGSSLDNSLYAFKGGYILGKYTGLENRSTRDLDMSIADSSVFDYIEKILKPILEQIVNEGKICGYRFKKPKVSEERNVSGGVVLYKKGISRQGTKKFKYSGIDISIHPLKTGGVIINQEGYSQYSFERSLSDKISVLYSTVDNIVRRIRDVYDIYCIIQVTHGSLNIKNCREFCELRQVNIYKKSVFESLLATNPSVLYSNMKVFMNDGDRVSKEASEYLNIERIFENVVWLLSMLREVE